MATVYCRLDDEWLLDVLTRMGVNPILVGCEELRVEKGDVIIEGSYYKEGGTITGVHVKVYHATGNAEHNKKLVYTKGFLSERENCLEECCCFCFLPRRLRYYRLYSAVHVSKKKKPAEPSLVEFPVAEVVEKPAHVATL